MASLEDADVEARGPTVFDRFTELLKSRPLYDYMLIGGADFDALAMGIEAEGIAFDSHCPQCNASTTWRVIADPVFFPGNMRSRLAVSAVKSIPVLQSAFRCLDFRCARDGRHLANFNLKIQLAGEKKEQGPRLRKIGQWPALADIAASDIDEYRPLLSKGDLAELKRAVGLAAHGVGIGSFVYLRRIFERLVAGAAQQAHTTAGLDLVEFAGKRMEDKLEAVKDFVPSWMVKNRKLYSILSTGLHELTEEACQTAFPAVKSAVLALLEQHAEQQRRNSRAREAELALEKLNQSLRGSNK